MAAPVGGAQTGGLVPAFTNTWNTETGRTVLYVEEATGGTSIIQAAAGSNGFWSVNNASPLYATAVASYIAARNYIAANTVFAVENQILLWVQGERDAQNLNGTTVTPTIYEDEFVDLINEFATDLGPILFFASELGATNDGSGEADFASIRAAQAAALNRVDFAYLVADIAKTFPATGRMVDNLHYTQTGYNDLGTLMATNAAATFNVVLPGDSEELTPAQVRALINVEDGATADRPERKSSPPLMRSLGLRTGNRGAAAQSTSSRMWRRIASLAARRRAAGTVRS